MKGRRGIPILGGGIRQGGRLLPRATELLKAGVGTLGERLSGGLHALERRTESALAGNAALGRARTSVGKRVQVAGKWIRRNPFALPLVGAGGTAAAAAILVLVAARLLRRRGPLPVTRVLFGKGAPLLAFRSLAGWLLRGLVSPGSRKPRTFRALVVRW
jgi:hypothetical protein